MSEEADIARDLRQIIEAVALQADQLRRLQELVERIALGLGVDPNAHVSRR